MSDPSPKRRGRPEKPAAERRRNNQVVRLRDATLEVVRKSAVDNQRSISEDLEGRVEQSIQWDDLIGSPETRALLVAIAVRLMSMERRFGMPWIEIDDPRFHVAMSRAMEEQLAMLQANTEFRPLTFEERARLDEPIPEPSPEEQAASEEAMARGEFGHHPDHDLPSDPEERAPGAPIMVPLPVQPAPAKRTRKKP